MFEKRKKSREEREIKIAFPLYPFVDLENTETRRQARDYLRTRPLQHVDGESEYVFLVL